MRSARSSSGSIRITFAGLPATIEPVFNRHFKSDSETKKDDHLGDVARVEVAVAPFGGD